VQFPKLGIALALSITAIAASAAPVPPKPSRWQQHVRETLKIMAPADAYFGSMKMTYIGMNNTFHDTAIQSGEHTTDAGIISRVSFAEDALADWAAKYPRDPQLARTYYLAFAVERKIWVKPNQDRAWEYLNRLVRDFPATYFGKLLKRDLAIGFTEHYDALPAPCTPAPSPPADADSSALPSASPSPSLSPTPSPAATTTSLKGGLHVQMIPQPCVPPPTPPPAPSPSPSASASPESPAPVAS
jgi:hypothetical protein